MKPFRVYEVVAGGLCKVSNYKKGFDSIEDAELFITSLRTSRIPWTKVQFVIQEYTASHRAKIVKLIDPI